MNRKDTGPKDPFLDDLRARYEEQKVNLPAGINDISGAVIGAAIEVHRHLGPGLLENAYEEAVCIELALRGIRFTRQVPLTVIYKGTTIATMQLDLLVEDSLAVELKAIGSLLPVHHAQVLAYLRASGLKLGLLINFNVARLTEGVSRVIDTARPILL
jgi:GxxExxY protein